MAIEGVKYDSHLRNESLGYFVLLKLHLDLSSPGRLVAAAPDSAAPDLGASCRARASEQQARDRLPDRCVYSGQKGHKDGFMAITVSTVVAETCLREVQRLSKGTQLEVVESGFDARGACLQTRGMSSRFAFSSAAVTASKQPLQGS